MSIPTLTIQDPESEVDEVLLALQSAVLKHPAASQAILSALTAEGRQYAQTEEGKLVLTTWRVWEGTSLWSFNPDEDCILPSAYVDALFMSAGSKDIESVIENLVNKDEPA